MAELSIPYVHRQLARRAASGGGVAVPGAVRLPGIPDVSGLYGQQEGLGQDITQAAGALAQVAARQQRARDVATLTEFETGFDEALGMKAVDLETDQRIHPEDRVKLLGAYREELFQERAKDLRSDLIPLAKARAYKGTERLMIDTKAQGVALGVKRALGALDVYEQHMEGKMLTEGDPAQYAMMQSQLKQKYAEYTEAGYLSEHDRTLRAYTSDQRLREAGVTLDMQQDGKGTLDRLIKGDYAGLSAESRVKLIDKAQAERRQQAEWQDAEDRRAEKAVAIEQNENESRFRERIYAAGGGAGSLAMLSEARQAREIGPDQHDRLMSFAINLQTARANQAAAAASRAASAATRQDIAQRRADDRQAGQLIALRNAGTPGPDGQVVTDETIIGMAASGKLDWTVAGRVSEQAAAHQRLLDSETDTAKKQAFELNRRNAESMFEMHSTRPGRSSIIDQAWSGFLDRYTAMVWQEGVDPRKAVEVLAPQYMAQAEDLITVRTQVLNGAMPLAYQAPIEQGYAGLEAAKAQLKEDWTLQALSREQYLAYARQLKEFESYAPYRKPAPKPPVITTPPATESRGWLGGVSDTISDMFKRERR